MKQLYFLLCLSLYILPAQSRETDTLKTPIPFSRIGFHEKIDAQRRQIEMLDGKEDAYWQASKNEEVNLHINDALYRRLNETKNGIEANTLLPSNNDKVRYLRYVEFALRYFYSHYRLREIKAAELPALLHTMQQAMDSAATGASILPAITDAPYSIAKIVSQVFEEHIQHRAADELVYLKFCRLHPDEILKTIRPYVDRPFADSLVVIAAQNNPVQLYSFAQSVATPEGKLIHRNTHAMVKTVVQLSQTPNALFYFPFLDNLLSGKQTIEAIKPLVGDGVQYDSLGYYKLLVATEIDYYKRMAPPMRDTPIAMFGANGLRQTLNEKAHQHFIKHINELHDVSNINVRMKAIQPLSPVELYYMMIMGESDLYTSSYKHSFNRMLQLMQPAPRGDSLLQAVHFDYFKKFIKMAANYNKLDTFLKTMPAANAEILMKAFVANLDQTGNLEDAVDVADSYSSITNKKLQATILDYVNQNKEKCLAQNNERGAIIYGLLQTIMLSADTSNKIDLTALVGIPSIYEIALSDLKDEQGRIVQQVFFYGDEDGKTFFPPFVNSFSAKDWKVTYKKEWVEIVSLRGNVFIYANRPLDYNENLDDSAQVHLGKYLKSLQMHPGIVVHRGHSYWLPGTIKRMPDNAKIVVLGSCGGYQNLHQILEVSPDAHIISTKEIGAGDINRPILNYMNQTFVSGNTLYWKRMWQTLSKAFASDPSAAIRESWEDYVPPYKNLGAIFLKAYNKQTGGEELGN